MREELLNPEPAPGEDVIDEPGLRPRRLEEFVGQTELKEHLSIILEAANEGASDVHFLPHGDSVLVRLRVDGILRRLRVVEDDLEILGRAIGALQHVPINQAAGAEERAILQSDRQPPSESPISDRESWCRVSKRYQIVWFKGSTQEK